MHYAYQYGDGQYNSVRRYAQKPHIVNDTGVLCAGWQKRMHT